jgi:hypothetical protein
MAFAVFNAAVNEDRRRWLQLWKSWPMREVFAHPDYVRLFARPVDHVVCAAWVQEKGGILFPMILRPLAVEPWAPNAKGVWDGTSPYGYGGPFGWNMSHNEVEAFWEEFYSWATEAGVVSVFARLSLFPQQLVPFAGEVFENATNIVRSLDLTEKELWRDYAHKVRKNVSRARNAGLVVEVDLKGEQIEDFIEIYYDTMRRCGAQEEYYFPRSIFESICENLVGQYAFIHVRKSDMVISTELVLISQSYIYSFLGGTREDAYYLRPNDLLKHELILWGMSAAKRAFVLGGGYTAGDGIFKYKLSFAPKGEVPFRTGRIILDAIQYAELVLHRRLWEEQAGKVWKPCPDFFPIYRA